MAPGALTPLIDLVFPARCPLCGAALAEQGGLCVDCWSRLTFPGNPACAGCQRPLNEMENVGEAVLCPPCQRHPPPHDGIAAATLYTEASRQLVLALKHGRRIALADLLGRLMASSLPPLPGEWVVVPVPLHRWRLWRRGFNQSALLAERLARAPERRLLVDALIRSRATPTLGGLDRHQRRQALESCMIVNRRHAELLDGANVLLVDDVVTSGARPMKPWRCCAGPERAASALPVLRGFSTDRLRRTMPTRKRPEPEVPSAHVTIPAGGYAPFDTAMWLSGHLRRDPSTPARSRGLPRARPSGNPLNFGAPEPGVCCCSSLKPRASHHRLSAGSKEGCGVWVDFDRVLWLSCNKRVSSFRATEKAKS